MTYSVKEIYFTLQGEGANVGRPSVFCRFAGCNLWSGREKDRSTAICQFCDTDFFGTDGPGGGKFRTPDALADAIAQAWPQNSLQGSPFVVCTGGEPLLQLDEALVEAFHNRGFEVAVETNGTLRVPPALDWICVSPKAGSKIVQRWGSELKLVYPQSEQDPADFEGWKFGKFFLQPMDGPNLAENTKRAVDYCLAHPRWRLSLQTQKLLSIP